MSTRILYNKIYDYGHNVCSCIQFLNIANFANTLIVLVVLNKKQMHIYCCIPISIVDILELSATNFVKLLIV